MRKSKEEDKEDYQSDEVRYQKIFINDEELCGAAYEDLILASKHLVECLQMRENYMRLSHQSLLGTASKFLQKFTQSSDDMATESDSSNVHHYREYEMKFANR